MSQIKSASIISYATILINIFIGMILTPIMLKYLGKSEYGIYMLVGSLVGYLALFDFGLNNTTVRFVSKYRHEGDKKGEEEFISTNFILYLGIALLIISVGLIGFIFLDNLFANKFSTAEMYSLKIMYLFMIINVVWLIVGGALLGIITAYEFFLFPKILKLVRIVLRGVTIFIVLFYGGKAIEIVLIDTFFNLMVFVSYYIFVSKKLNIKFGISKFNKIHISTVFSYSVWIFLGILMDQLYWRSGHTILGMKSTASEIAIYAIGLLFVSYYMTLSSAISGLFLPTATKMYVREASKEELTGLMIKVGRIQWFVISNMLFGLFFFGKQFIRLWVGEGYDDSWYIAIIIMMALTIPSIQNVGNSLLEAYNLHPKKIKVNIIFAVLSVFLGFILVEQYGSIGLAATTALGLIFGQIIFNNYYFKKTLGLDIKKYVSSMLEGNLKALPIIITTCFGLNLIELGSGNWANLVLKIVLFIFCSCLSTYLIAMNTFEKNLVNGAFLKIKSVIKK